jgi:hypothetical protein
VFKLHLHSSKLDLRAIDGVNEPPLPPVRRRRVCLTPERARTIRPSDGVIHRAMSSDVDRVFDTERSSSARGTSSSEPKSPRSSRFAFAASSSAENDNDARPASHGYRSGVELYQTTKHAREHRCNDRLEDVVQSLFEGNPLLTTPPAWSLFVKCIRSEVGDEPREPFLYHTPQWLQDARKREKEKRGRRWFGGG